MRKRSEATEMFVLIVWSHTDIYLSKLIPLKTSHLCFLSKLHFVMANFLCQLGSYLLVRLTYELVVRVKPIALHNVGRFHSVR